MHLFLAEDVTNIKTRVSANILGIPFPFVGVDGENACKDISKLDGTKVGCNLKAGEEYLYNNKIEVLRIYPKVTFKRNKFQNAHSKNYLFAVIFIS